MKVLLLNGSANKNGNTFTALSEIDKQLERAASVSRGFRGAALLGLGSVGFAKRHPAGCRAANPTERIGNDSNGAAFTQIQSIQSIPTSHHSRSLPSGQSREVRKGHTNDLDKFLPPLDHTIAYMYWFPY